MSLPLISPRCRFAALVVFSLLLSSMAGAQDRPGGGRGGLPEGGDKPVIPVDPNAGKWNLTEMDENYKGGIQLLSDEKYSEAYDFFVAKKKELGKKKGKETKEPKKKVQFLANLAKELVGVQKLAAKPSEKSLARAIASTNKYRESFALFKFLALEDEIRDRLGKRLVTFDYTPQYFVTDTAPLDPFTHYKPAMKFPSPYSVTSDLKIVPQGRYCYHWKDSPDRRTMSAYFPFGEMSWQPYKYLCFKAKLADPKAATLQLYATTHETDQNRYEMGCGTWKGWKNFRINFRKDASVDRRNTHVKMSWERIYAIGFYTRGGLTDFYLDDVRLTLK